MAERTNLSKWDTVTIVFANSTFYLAHWVFSWKYWPVAKHISGDKKSGMAPLYGMSVIVVMACIIYGYFQGKLDVTHKKDTEKVEMELKVLRYAWGVM